MENKLTKNYKQHLRSACIRLSVGVNLNENLNKRDFFTFMQVRNKIQRIMGNNFEKFGSDWFKAMVIGEEICSGYALYLRV